MGLPPAKKYNFSLLFDFYLKFVPEVQFKPQTRFSRLFPVPYII